MTVETQESTQETEIQFTAEEQKFIDKLVGSARVKSREQAKADFEAQSKEAQSEAERTRLATENEWKKLAEMHEGRVRELEPYETEAKAYRELIEGMLKDKVKVLGDAAKKAVAGLPESLSALERLSWLNQNEGLFAVESTPKVGTPIARSKSALTDKGREQHRRLRL